MKEEISFDEALEKPEFWDMYLKQMDEEFEERRRDLTICLICDSRSIKIADLGDGVPTAYCDQCFDMLQKDIEQDKMTKLGQKLRYVMGDVPKRLKKTKKLRISYQKDVIECIERICTDLGIDTQREYRVGTGRVDLILKTPQRMVAIEIERQKQVTSDKVKIMTVGKGAIIFDTYKDKIDEEFIKQLVSSETGIKVFV